MKSTRSATPTTSASVSYCRSKRNTKSTSPSWSNIKAMGYSAIVGLTTKLITMARRLAALQTEAVSKKPSQLRQQAPLQGHSSLSATTKNRGRSRTSILRWPSWWPAPSRVYASARYLKRASCWLSLKLTRMRYRCTRKTSCLTTSWWSISESLRTSPARAMPREAKKTTLALCARRCASLIAQRSKLALKRAHTMSYTPTGWENQKHLRSHADLSSEEAWLDYWTQIQPNIVSQKTFRTGSDPKPLALMKAKLTRLTLAYLLSQLQTSSFSKKTQVIGKIWPMKTGMRSFKRSTTKM